MPTESIIFGIFNELVSAQNVNAARFARNIKWDFFEIFKHCVSTIVKRVTIYLGWNLIDPQIISFFFAMRKKIKRQKGTCGFYFNDFLKYYSLITTTQGFFLKYFFSQVIRVWKINKTRNILMKRLWLEFLISPSIKPNS